MRSRIPKTALHATKAAPAAIRHGDGQICRSAVARVPSACGSILAQDGADEDPSEPLVGKARLVYGATSSPRDHDTVHGCETMVEPLVVGIYRAIIQNQGLLGGAGFRPSTV